VALGICLFSSCGLVRRPSHRDISGLGAPLDQPDKVLYEKAVNEITHARYDVGRLTLQTLINTYPDSEYLSKAKLAIADSYYKEGGVSGLTQAEAEYKDFITFFPTAPEAPEAQFRVGLAHFHLMGKADRDRQEALLAEAEFKEFLLKYPDSPLMPRAKARLREVQEVLGQSDYQIAHFYFMKGAMPAARSRFQEIVDHYPSFSQTDAALWYLGQSWEKIKQPAKATPSYARLLSYYPLSSYAGDAKSRLATLHQPIPKPTKAVMARARADALRHRRSGLMARLQGTLSSAPDYSATRHGPAQLGGIKKTETQAAKGSVPPAAGAEIAVQPVPDTALSSGKPADPNSEGKTSAAPAGAPNQQPATSTSTQDSVGHDPKAPTGSSSDSNSDKSSGDVPPPRKKKGKFHFLKKVVP
jgi:outer membrane protein assembly factor BamD